MSFYQLEILMSLNIKNEEAHQLARELVQLTGETMTGAVTVALRERLERERRERSLDTPNASGYGLYANAVPVC